MTDEVEIEAPKTAMLKSLDGIAEDLHEVYFKVYEYADLIGGTAGDRVRDLHWQLDASRQRTREVRTRIEYLAENDVAAAELREKLATTEVEAKCEIERLNRSLKHAGDRSKRHELSLRDCHDRTLRLMRWCDSVVAAHCGTDTKLPERYKAVFDIVGHAWPGGSK